MRGFIENAVTFEQIATVSKRNPADIEAEARECGVFIGVDWAGRPAVKTSAARGLVSGDSRRAAEHGREHRELEAKAEAWTVERSRVVREAGRVDGMVTPEKAAAAREVAVEAGKAFERKCPADIAARAGLVYLSDAERGTLLGRAARRVREMVT